MAQYQAGTVDVTNGSATVKGNNTAFTSFVQIGDLFAVAGQGLHYEIAAVVDDGEITLSAAYQGQSGNQVAYAVTRDFSPFRGYPLINPGDYEAVSLVRRAVAGIDGDIEQISKLGHFLIESKTTSTPPASPDQDDRYIVPSGATGDWAGHADEIAAPDGAGGWTFSGPKKGWRVLVVDDDYRDYVYNGGAWVDGLVVQGLNQAADAADDAQGWAIHPEDSQFTDSDGTSGYSALHHANKAAESASNAGTSESNAAASATDAGEHETTAARYATEAEDRTVVDANTGQDTGDYSALHHAAKAADSASAAATSESNAASSASAASTSASDAATAETDAQDWATAAEDTQVTDADGNSGYSARHHAAKADASASAAATSESNAATSASNAATSETNAANSASSAATSASNADTYETNAQQHRDDAQAARDAAQTARDDAQQAETDAQSARDAAQVAETDAGEHKTTAERWATEVEDTTVVDADTGQDTGKHSALHHAAKAADSASTAQTAETGAVNAEGQAQTYRDEAYDWAEAPKDQSVSDSAGNTGYSAFHWAEKAAANAQTAQDGIPAGVIVMWSGAITAVPPGWALCDGANGTPDLRDRFVVGAGSTYAVDDTGGSLTTDGHALTEAEMPSHTHSASLSNVAVRANNGNGDQADPTGHFPAIANYLQDRDPQEVRSYAASANTNMATGMFSGQVTIGNTGGSQAHAHTYKPPYYALAYIMKV